MADFIKELNELYQEFPEPFAIEKNIKAFYNSPTAKELIANEKNTITKILNYLNNAPDPHLAMAAVLLLSYFNPDQFYETLLNILKKSPRAVVEAFEHGIWHVRLKEEKIAADLINAVISTGNANLLLLLQRPIVAMFKRELKVFVESKETLLSLYAMYCYKYALAKSDTSFLNDIANNSENPEMRALAKSYLEELRQTNNQ